MHPGWCSLEVQPWPAPYSPILDPDTRITAGQVGIQGVGLGVLLGSAMSFTPSATDQLTRIDLALTYDTIAVQDGGNSDAAAVTLNSDNAGRPGAVLMTWNVGGLPSFPGCCGVDTLVPTSPTLLTSGTRYWIVVTPGNSGSADTWNWNINNTPGLMASNNSGVWYPASDIMGAFDVIGTPEPSTPVLLGIALALSLVHRFFGSGSALLKRGVCPRWLRRQPDRSR
jgi:hypothetical protein